MKDLYSFLDEQSQNSSFNAELSKRGGFITFSNSGKRGEIKYFQIGLDSILQTLKDILDNLNEFNTISEYEEKAWRDKGSGFFNDPVANANSTVQTKPLFSTLSKVIIWGNQPRLNDINPDKTIVLDELSLKTAIKELEIVADSFRPKQLIQKVPNNLPLQQIFYGAPGTGKSNSIKRNVDDKGKINYRVTFHPDTDYSTFVGTYKPTMKENIISKNGVETKEEQIVYRFVPQTFTKAYTAAWNTEEDVYLIIEEINRGNCAQIFGDLFQLLDRREDGFSEYPIDTDSDLAKHIAKELAGSPRANFPNGVKEGKKLLLPSNFYIWATMNTSDQSLFPIDSAFKRRWDWQYIPISDGKKGWKIEANGKRYDWWQFLQKINDQIGSTTNSEDKKLGYYFCKAKNGIIDAETFVGKVMFYIWNDVYKDFAEEAGDLFKDSDGSLLSFNKFYTVGENRETMVVGEKVMLLLQNLGVMPDDYVTEEDTIEDEDGNTVSSLRRDYSKFSINGIGKFGKNKLASECMKKYIELNPDMPVEDVLANWRKLGNIVPHFVESKEEYESRSDNSRRSYGIPCGDSVIYVTHDGFGNNGKVFTLIEAVNTMGWGITLSKVEE